MGTKNALKSHRALDCGIWYGIVPGSVSLCCVCTTFEMQFCSQSQWSWQRVQNISAELIAAELDWPLMIADFKHRSIIFRRE